MMQPGMYRMPANEYHEEEALSHGGIVRLLKSPAHYRLPVVETKIMQFGEAFHMAFFEPDRYSQTYAVRPEGFDSRSKAGKAWAQVRHAENASRKIISHEDAKAIKGMCAAIRTSQTAMELLSDGMPEVSGFWQDPIYPDVTCKIRPDWINTEKRILVDLKKCQDARHEGFQRVSYALGYHLQAAWYLYGLTQITRIEHKDFYFVAVEKEAPYGVQVYQVEEDAIQEGLIACNRAVELYRQCREAQKWPCYEEGIIGLSLPPYARKQAFNVISQQEEGGKIYD